LALDHHLTMVGVDQGQKKVLVLVLVLVLELELVSSLLRRMVQLVNCQEQPLPQDSPVGLLDHRSFLLY
jgi:hypothetical protein